MAYIFSAEAAEYEHVSRKDIVKLNKSDLQKPLYSLVLVVKSVI